MNPQAPSDPLVAALEQLGTHEHLCSIYNTRAEHYAAAIPYIRIGLDRGEKCIYITGDDNERDVRDAMHAGGIDVERVVGTNALLITNKEQSYLQKGAFDPDWIFSFWKDAAGRALSEGYSGLRVTGETDWLHRGVPGARRWMEYESRLTRVLAEYECNALCQYDRSKHSPAMVRDVISTHPTVIYGGSVCRNLYYIPPAEFLGRDQTEHEVERLLTNINERERFEHTRRQQRDELRESEERLRLMLEGVRDYALFLLDTEGRVTSWNIGAERMHGYRETEILGQHFERFYPAADVSRGLPRELLQEAAADGKMEQDGPQVRQDGSHFWAHMQLTALRKDGELVGYCKVTRDITERRRAEEALREMDDELARVSRVLTVGELTASIAHEVNQPLCAVITNGSACLRWLSGATPNLDEARAAVERIVRDGNRASEIIARIRALVRKTGNQKKSLDVNEVIREVVTFSRLELQKNAVVLRTELVDDLPSVLGDRVQLQQVLLNLIMNGVEAMSGTSDHAQQLSIRTQHTGEGGVRVAVEDSGVGIPAGHAERVFQSFYTTKPQGMGIGLSISRTIVEEHGGRLVARSNAPTAGATFEFTPPPTERAGPDDGNDLAPATGAALLFHEEERLSLAAVAWGRG